MWATSNPSTPLNLTLRVRSKMISGGRSIASKRIATTPTRSTKKHCDPGLASCSTPEHGGFAATASQCSTTSTLKAFRVRHTTSTSTGRSLDSRRCTAIRSGRRSIATRPTVDQRTTFDLRASTTSGFRRECSAKSATSPIRTPASLATSRSSAPWMSTIPSGCHTERSYAQSSRSGTGTGFETFPGVVSRQSGTTT